MSRVEREQAPQTDLNEAAPQAAAPKWRSLAQDDSAAAAFAQRRPFVAGVSIKELQPGTGERAELGMWVAVHYTIRLVGDGSVLVDTRTSGYGDRDYGCPEEFTLGQLQDESVLRALHACVIDMHTACPIGKLYAVLGCRYSAPPRVVFVTTMASSTPYHS